MWKSVLTLSALVAYVAAVPVIAVPAKGRPGYGPYPGETEFSPLDVVAWNGNPDNPADPIWMRSKSTWNLRNQDTIYKIPADVAIKPGSKLPVQYKETLLPNKWNADDIAEFLNKGGRVYVTNMRWKGGNKLPAVEGQVYKKASKPNEFGFMLVRANANLPRLSILGSEFNVLPVFKDTLTAAEYVNDEKRKEEKAAKAKAKKEVAALQGAGVVKSGGNENELARYVNDGDYYGYAGEYYDGIYDDEFENIDASRLIEYAYNMGLRAGSKKASQHKRRYDYYYR